MELQGDGTPPKNSGRRDKCVNQNQQSGLGETRHSSAVSGAEEQGRSAANDSEWRNTSGTNSYDRHSPVGKILQRLKLIEAEHLDYIHSHQERLEARLDDSRQREESFKQKVAELEQEIYKLATSFEN